MAAATGEKVVRRQRVADATDDADGAAIRTCAPLRLIAVCAQVGTSDICQSKMRGANELRQHLANLRAPDLPRDLPTGGARVDVRRVVEALKNTGYFLQMPPGGLLEAPLNQGG